MRLDSDAKFGRRQRKIVFTPTGHGTRLLVESGLQMARSMVVFSPSRRGIDKCDVPS